MTITIFEENRGKSEENVLAMACVRAERVHDGRGERGKGKGERNERNKIGAELVDDDAKEIQEQEQELV